MLTPAWRAAQDEPTNHLDIPSKEMLEEALSNFEVRPCDKRRSLSHVAHSPTAQGTVLAVSHDRYFLRKIATRVLELKNGVMDDYSGDYECASPSRPRCSMA